MMTVQDARSILVVEGDPYTAETVSAVLESAGYQASTLSNARHALDEVQQMQPDLIMLDVSHNSGLEVLRQLRASSTLPLIALNDGRPRDRVMALEAGADDVIAAPISRDELVARVNALFRRVERAPQADDRIVVRSLELYVTRRIVTLKGRRLHLTPIEYSILSTLMRGAGHTVTHEDLLREVWGSAYEGDFSVLRVNVSRLRQKLEENPRSPTYIVTVPGEGYIMQAGARR